MPSEFIHGVAAWPGVQSFEGAQYSLSHGISPGICIYRMSPQDSLPAEFGDLTITDGNEEVVLPDCRVQSWKVERDDKGFFWLLEIADRRWRWREFGSVFGIYNQYAPVGQLRLIPWTIRSPKELAELCLGAMGEQNYDISNMPDGINYPGAWYPNPIINASGLNPPVDWNGIPPAHALQQVADRCGCRIIYRWSDDAILITPIGAGVTLPMGSIAKKLPSIIPPKAPSGVGVIGSPTRYQMRLGLVAVGEEWDGSYLPIHLLSYAPKFTFTNPAQPALPQITNVTFKGFAVGGVTSIKLTLTDDQGEPHTIGVTPGATDALTAAAAQTAAAAAAASDTEWAQVTATVASNVLTITGNAEGDPFDLSADYFASPIPNPAPKIVVETTQAAQPEQEPNQVSVTSWKNCWPPYFYGVQATDQLTVADAQRLAQRSVYRCYQLSGVDVDGTGPPYVPGYGRVLRTMQIVLQDTQVDQISPEIDNNILISSPTIIPPGANNEQTVQIPVTVNFYNGFSRDKAAAVFGSIAYSIVNDLVIFKDSFGNFVEDANTPAGGQVFVPFQTEPDYFMIRFGSPVFRLDDEGFIEIPNLTLQTAVMVRDPDNNQIVPFIKIRPLLGGDPDTPPAMRHFPDVQVNVSCAYDVNNNLLIDSVNVLEQDPLVRAEFYLDGLTNEYQYKQGLIVEYNNIRALDVDGLNWQITWNIDSAGCTTTVSQNCEHSIWIPPLAARRRAEYLPPVPRVRVNMARPEAGDAVGGPRALRGVEGD